jgi:sec-independent protein translocase protein TatC
MATGNLNQQESALEYEEDLDGATMSLVDHLEELRWRIFKSLIAIAVTSIIAFIFRDHIVHFLALPLPIAAEQLTHGRLVVTGIMEGFTVMLLISIAVGVVMALPVILYQAWAFIAPGLYQHEKKHAVPLGYFVLRYPIDFLVSFAASSFVELVTANSYFTFVAFFILAFGLVFEIPLVLTFLAKVGLVSGETLKRKRATMHIGMWIAATVLTPGADIYSPIFLGVAMSFLYELSIIFIKYFVKPETS